MGLSRQEYSSGLPFPSPVGHILSDLSTMTHLSWVAPRAWLSFIELDKSVVLVWLDWLVFCEYGFSLWYILLGICLASCMCTVLRCSVMSTLCNPMNGSPPSSFVHGIFQARILAWVAISPSRGSSWPRIKPMSLVAPVLAGTFFTTNTTWESRRCWPLLLQIPFLFLYVSSPLGSLMQLLVLLVVLTSLFFFCVLSSPQPR